MEMNEQEQRNDREKKRQFPFLTLFVIILLVLVFALLFFSIYYRSKTPTKTEVATVQLTVVDTGSITVFDEMVPMSDEDGQKITGYRLKVTNNGTQDGRFQLLIEDVSVGSITDGCTTENQLTRDQLRYTLYRNNQKIQTGDLSDIKMNILDEQNIASGQTYDYELKIWISEAKEDTDWMNRHYHYQLTIDPITKEA